MKRTLRECHGLYKAGFRSRNGIQIESTQEDRESHLHLFFDCPFSSLIWKAVKTKCGLVFPTGDLVAEVHWGSIHCKDNSVQAIVFKLCIAASVYYIWKERKRGWKTRSTALPVLSHWSVAFYFLVLISSIIRPEYSQSAKPKLQCHPILRSHPSVLHEFDLSLSSIEPEERGLFLNIWNIKGFWRLTGKPAELLRWEWNRN